MPSRSLAFWWRKAICFRFNRLWIGIHDAFRELAARGFQDQLGATLAGGPITNADVGAARSKR